MYLERLQHRIIIFSVKSPFRWQSDISHMILSLTRAVALKRDKTGLMSYRISVFQIQFWSSSETLKQKCEKLVATIEAFSSGLVWQVYFAPNTRERGRARCQTSVARGNGIELRSQESNGAILHELLNKSVCLQDIFVHAFRMYNTEFSNSRDKAYPHEATSKYHVCFLYKHPTFSLLSILDCLSPN